MLLALAMMLGMLTGRSGGDSSETQNPSGTNAGSGGDGEVRDVTLKVWVPEEKLEITKQMAESFNAAHPELNFFIDISVVGIGEANSLLETDYDTVADIMQMPTGGIPAEVERGLLLPIVYDIDTINSLYGEGPLGGAAVDDGFLLGGQLPGPHQLLTQGQQELGFQHHRIFVALLHIHGVDVVPGGGGNVDHLAAQTLNEGAIVD